MFHTEQHDSVVIHSHSSNTINLVFLLSLLSIISMLVVTTDDIIDKPRDLFMHRQTYDVAMP